MGDEAAIATTDSSPQCGWGPVPCNLCDSDDYEVVFEAGVAQQHRIVRCRKCELMYASPRDLQAEVRDILTWPPDASYRWLTRNSMLLAKQNLQVRDFRRTKRDLGRMFPDRGRIIEIGCSTGALLADLAGDGWEVEGVEPWAEAALYANKERHVNVHACTLEGASLPDQYADVVIMLHVIEHVPDPLAVLREVYRILRPGGLLVVETPRYDSLMFRLLGHRERSVRCDGHVYFFTTKTLRQMGERARLEHRNTLLTGRSLTLSRLGYNVGVMTKSLRVAAWLERWSPTVRLDKLHVYLNLRDMQRMYLRRSM